jgi:hypothetical protein
MLRIGVRACARTRELGAQGALGISVKIGDGNIDVLYMVVSELLERLGIGTDAQRAARRVPSAAHAEHAGCRIGHALPVRAAAGLTRAAAPGAEALGRCTRRGARYPNGPWRCRCR